MDNGCSVVVATLGTAVPNEAQIVGDCQVLTCDGQGGTRSSADDADLPVDGQDCTADVCTDGVPSNPAINVGAPCEVGRTCNAAGQCVQCQSASDCTGGTFCAPMDCVFGECVATNELAGTALPDEDQTPNDCARLQCDGAGGVESATDPADLPADDSNQCTVASCSGGPNYVPLQTGLPCTDNGGTVCDGAGACVACNSDFECGTSTECELHRCVDNACVVENVTAGTVVTMQTSGDCQRLECDGAGGTQSVADDTDLPDDLNACTNDTCSGGVPGNDITPGAGCGVSGVCDAGGQCVGCNVATDCGADSFCRSWACTDNVCEATDQPALTPLPSGDQTAGDCQALVCDGAGGVGTTADPVDIPSDDGNECTVSACNGGTPTQNPTSAGSLCNLGDDVCDGAGTCVQCLTAANCGFDSFCVSYSCDPSNNCVQNNTAAGTDLPSGSQFAADCQVFECDGLGDTRTVALDTDVPVDGNPCTQDVCTDGAPSNPPEAQGQACSVGSGILCDGNGACVECNAPSDCGTDTECLTFTCTSGTCGSVPAPLGTVVSSQTAGDCQSVQCDGTGSEQSVADDTDLPDDGIECTEDLCNLGSPAHPPTTANVTCSQNGGSYCDGAGACVECTGASQCGSPSFCEQFACNMGSCESIFTASGADLPAEFQTDGDCRVEECDGAGGIQSTPANGDIPVDGVECTDDVCTSGTPSNPPSAVDSVCTVGGTVCDGAGDCVACNSPSQCGTDTFCLTYTCVDNACGSTPTSAGTPLASGDQSDGDCREAQCDGAGGTQSAIDDADLPVDGDDCTDDICTAGTPSNPASAENSPCTSGGGTVCDGAGMCVGCTEDSQCGTNTECTTYTCNMGTCETSYTAAGTALSAGQQTAGDCVEVQCDGSGGTQDGADDSDLPVDGNDCTNDVCTSGTPSNPPVAVDTGCGTGQYCDGAGACVDCNSASQCGTDTVCQTFTCTGGGTCQTNNVAAGTDLPGGSQMGGDCQVLECDGLGAVRSVALDTDVPVDGMQCTEDVCTSGAPSNPNSSAGQACTESGGSQCNGMGSCVECLVADDCGTSTFCRSFACSNGACQINDTAMGTPLVSGQTSGDCQQLVCDGSGGVTSEALNSDLPNDSNPCTDDSCDAGTPDFTNVMDGTSCGGVATCQSGICQGCTVAADCGTDDFCVSWSCDEVGMTGVFQCNAAYTAAGTDLPGGDQTAGDCQVLECDGAGNTISTAFNTDLPDDMNECTNDVCSSGVPQHPARALNTACGTGFFCDGAGSCVECNNEAQCGTDTFCANYTCNGSNTCEVAFTANGTDLPMGSQTAGDCHVLECDGAGNVLDSVNNADVNVDGNPCTQDICSAGTPSNPDEPIDTACGGGDVCNGAGACVECNSPSQCGTDTDCLTFSCSSNTCGSTPTSAGTPTTSQTGGDCREVQCDGAGGTTNAIDNTDLPNDSNECTTDTCSAGVPQYTNRAINTACGIGDYCDGAGSCVDCNTASQCGTSTECRTYTCVSKSCGFTNTSAGTPLASQTSGDCREWQCNGAGGSSNAIDNSDLPVDGNACTQDVCTSGTPSNPNEPIDTACGSGDYCDGSGSCVDCNSPSQCGTTTDCRTYTCNSNTCGFTNTAFGTPTSSQTSGDCREWRCTGSGGSANYIDNSDLPVDGNACTDDVCTSGTPSNPNEPINTPCGTGDYCNGAGSCVDCTTPSQCGTTTECRTYTCNSNNCGFTNTAFGTPLASQTSGNCREWRCNGSGGSANYIDNSDLPVDGNQCTQDICSSGTPSNPIEPNGTSCSDGNGCNGTDTCSWGSCSVHSGNPCDSQCQTCTNWGGTPICSNRSAGYSCSTPASGRNNVCHVSQCDGSGTCGRRYNRFNGATGMSANSTSYSYTNVASFSPCTSCHGWTFTESFSETSASNLIFDSYCEDWNTNTNRPFYGYRNGGCILYLVDDGIMPASGTWSYPDEYLRWWCSASGPAGGVWGW